MTLLATPVLGINLMAENALQKEVLFNEAMLTIDAIISGTVIDFNNTPPGSPSDGDVHVVGTSPTGVWSGEANAIAYYYNGWQFFNPPTRFQVYDLATSSFFNWNGTAWSAGLLAATSLAGDSDVTITSPAIGQVLVYNGSKWVNSNKADLPAGSLITATGSLALDRANGEVQRLSLTGNVTAFTVANWPATDQLGRLVLEIQNTGAYNIAAWPTGTKWPGGTAPTITSGLGQERPLRADDLRRRHDDLRQRRGPEL